VVDGGGNGASGNAEAAQCHLIVCSDGSGWQPPVRPPEPLDPLEGGLPARPSTPPAPPPPPASPSPPPPLVPWQQGLTYSRVTTPGVVPPGVVAPQGGPRRTSSPVRALRLAVVRCTPRRAARRGARVICRAPYQAKPTSRRLTGRLIRRGKTFAHGARRVRPGRQGSLAMLSRRRPKPGRYTLALTFRDARGRASLVRQPVRVP
jgi:hypothetical protein